MNNWIDLHESELLSRDFLKKYDKKQPKWGFNGLGYIVYKRTYSRKKDNGEMEEWYETVARAINGAQKIGAEYTRHEAERLYDYVFNLKCNFAGRSLWQLGTPVVDRFGANSLINCFYLSITSLEDFCFLFENLMMGSGVGFSVRREHIHELPRIKHGVKIVHENTKDADFICPDSRRGWVQLLRLALDSFFYSGKSFTYSTLLVRGYGEPIKGFGGTASGPQILIDGISKMCQVLNNRVHKKLRSIDVLDICNIIGSIVVAGNVRRSSEIALGDADDHLFIQAKRWDLGNIPNWRAMSNNTILADDFSYLSDKVWDGYNGNSEPYGLMNLPLCQKYGRLGEKIKDNCEGTNPCVRGDTIIAVVNKGYIRIDSVIDQEIQTWNGFNWVKVTPKITGYNQKIYKIILDNGKFLCCTEYHRWVIDCPQENYAENNYDQYYIKETKDLKIGDSLHFFPGEPIQPSIISIEYLNIEEKVYCYEEKEKHLGMFNGIVTQQCGEISLESGESCNLAELYLNNIESKHELIDCSKLLYKTQKAICALPYLHKLTSDIVHKNFRLGQGVTGICQSLDKLDWLDDCYNELRKFDKEWSKKRGWPESIKLTTCKPSGTLSLLSGNSPGIHPIYSKYFIRRVRISSSDPLVNFCKDLGYHTEFVINFDKTEDKNTIIIEFPCECLDAISAQEMSAIKQLELVKQIQTIWSDNSVSCTVYYKKEELPEIKEWLSKNYENSIKSISFLLHKEEEHGFIQPPYEEISAEKYKELCKDIKPIKIVKDIGNNQLDGLECAGGACPIR